AGERARELLGRVGLGDRLDHFPTQLSGGEQQRVAIARAFANSPRILFADEPTGNLDSETGAHIVELLESLNRESKTTIILVTHDLTLASRAQRIIRLSDGRVVSENRNAPATPAIDSLLDSLSKAGVRSATSTGFVSMALVPRSGGTRLVQ